MARSISAKAISGFVRAVRRSAGTPARSNRDRLLVQLSGRNNRNASTTGTSDTPNDGASNGSAGVNSAPDVNPGANGAPDLGGRRCRDHEDRGDNANYRNLAEHKIATCPVPFQQPP